MDTITKDIIDTLIKNNYECYIVGGAVRDKILKLPCQDIDLATNAKPDVLQTLFKQYKINLVGTNFNVTMINDIEVATYRKDIYKGDGLFIENSNSLQEDLKRRDLTINAIAMNPITNEIIDPHNGKKNLKNKIIRFVGDPGQRIKEDPLRMLRACRFLAKINGRFHPDTFDAIQKNHHLLKDIPKERYRIEILKAMKIQKASKFFRALDNTNLMQYIFPEMIDSHMDGGEYHNETIFNHMMMAGDEVSTNRLLLKLASYIHDIGKPLSFKLNSDESFIGHEKTGCDIALKNLARMKFSIEEQNFILDVIRYHMHNIKEICSKPRNIRRFLNKIENNKKSKNYDFRDFWTMHIVDNKANLGKENFTNDETANFISSWLKVENAKEPFNIKNLAINGKDIMNFFSIDPGSQVGKILQFLMERVLDDPKLNNDNDLFKILRENKNELFEKML